MGLFSRKSKRNRDDEFAELEDAFGLSEAQDKVERLREAGAPVTHAVVEGVHDTGETALGDEPIVVLTVRVDARQRELRTPVSRIEVPRRGETVALFTDPDTGDYLYAGLAL